MNEVHCNSSDIRPGQYDDSNIDNLYVEAWNKTQGKKNTFWLAVVSILLIYAIAIYLAPTVAAMITGAPGIITKTLLSLLRLAILLFLVTPLFTGLLMMSIRYCSGKQARFDLLIEPFIFWKQLWVYPIVLLGFSIIEDNISRHLLTQCIIYFSHFVWLVGFLFFLPLTIEKKRPIADTLILNIQLIQGHWAKILNFAILAIIILFASLFTLGIAWIWIFPWLLNAFAVFYLRLQSK